MPQAAGAGGGLQTRLRHPANLRGLAGKERPGLPVALRTTQLLSVRALNMSQTNRRIGPLVAACGVSLALLAPFSNKAFHVDDTLFLYAARQIRKSPWRPYDFTLNWNGIEQRMWEVTKNPPLTSYYIAAVTAAFGEREVPLHACFLLWALIATAGLYWLASRLDASPGWSAVLLAVSPAFVVTATGVSSDLMTLALYVLAVAAFVHGSQQRSWRLLVLAGTAAGLATVTKYIALTVIPLLAAYSIISEKRVSARLAVLLVPLAIFGVWAAHGWCYYGKPHWITAATYASHMRGPGGAFRGLRVVALERGYLLAATAAFFAGGMGLTILLPAFHVKGRKRAWLAAWPLAAVSAGAALWLTVRYFGLAQSHWINLVLLGTLVGGAALFAWWVFTRGSSWSAQRALLLLWLFGILVFVALFNWTVALRSVLFAVPPAVLLLGLVIKEGRLRAPVVAAFAAATAMLALAVAAADTHWAGAYRSVAAELDRPGSAAPAPRYFNAHWGLQYYLEKANWHASRIDQPPSRGQTLLLAPVAQSVPWLERFVGDQMRRGRNRSQALDAFIGAAKGAGWQPLRVSALFGIHTHNRWVHAGLYSSADGPLPYAFGTLPCEVFLLRRPASRFANTSADPPLARLASAGSTLSNCGDRNTAAGRHRPRLATRASARPPDLTSRRDSSSNK